MRKLLLMFLFSLNIFTINAFADSNESAEANSTILENNQSNSDIVNQLINEHPGAVVDRNALTETLPANINSDYGKININAQFDNTVDVKDFVGCKVTLTPVELDYLQDIAEIPTELLIPDPIAETGEEYEEYEVILTDNNNFSSYEKIYGRRVINIKVSVPNITVVDNQKFFPFGDNIYEIDFEDKDISGFYANKEYFIINEPGQEVDINILVSKNDNPRRISLDKAEIKEDTKRIVNDIYESKSNEVNITIENIETEKTLTEKVKEASPVILFIILGVGIATAIYIFLKKRDSDED